MNEVVYWSALFPLGVYTVCTHQLARIFEQPPLEAIPNYFA
jgi:hypothetical protein